MLKIQVYTICKNEIESIMPWYNCIKDEQDEIYITDTGSSDGTYEKFLELKNLDNKIHLQRIEIIPWRFDTQRNLSLLFVPYEYDVGVSLDMDETLSTGWRKIIEKVWIKDETNTILYDYIHSWADEKETVPLLTFKNFKIHSRKNIVWKYIVHEVPERIDGKEQIVVYTSEIISKHHKKHSNNKNLYIPLLLIGAKEHPNDQKMWHQLGNQYFCNKQYEQSIESNTKQVDLYFKLNLNINKGMISEQIMEIQEQNLRISLNDQQEGMDADASEIIKWAVKLLYIAPKSRESWQYLGKLFMIIDNYPLQYGCIKTAQNITNKNESVFVYNEYWDTDSLKNLELDQKTEIKKTIICKDE